MDLKQRGEFCQSLGSIIEEEGNGRPARKASEEGNSIRDGSCAEAAAQQSLASLLAPMGRKVVAPGV